MKNRCLNLLGIILCVITFNKVCANALPFQTTDPIQVESDKVEFIQNTGEIIYEGHVVVQSLDRQLFADRVIVHKNPTQGIHTFKAIGHPAHFIHTIQSDDQPVEGEALQIDYFPETAQLILTGQAKITHNQDIFNGPLLEYQLSDQKIIATAQDNHRPKMILFPKESAS